MDAAYYAEKSKSLVDCAMGRTPADIVIRHGIWVCVQTGEFIEKTDIAILDERIAYVGPDATHTIGNRTQIIEANGRYLVPGLLDGHMHVESGMLTVTEFVRAVVPRGTTGIFVDPHEIANVFGMRGVRLMVDEARQQPIHVYVQMPSCVPSAPGLETPGAAIGPEEVAESMTWTGIIGLGEMMNFPGVFNSDSNVHLEMGEARKAGKVIGGHYAAPLIGNEFYGYAAGGPEDDHEGTTLEDAVMRARQGMKVMMRYGSAWHDVAAQVKAVTQLGLDPRHFLLCTDDSHSATLIQEGHMDRVLRHAIGQGLPEMTAIQMATINTADHFGLQRDMGMIAPGRFADVLLVEDLVNFRVDLVIAKGKQIAEQGKLLIDLPKIDYPGWVINSIHIGRDLTGADFAIPSKISTGEGLANVIGVIENQAPTKHLVLAVPVVDGFAQMDPDKDILKIAVIERHHGSGRVQTGFVHGFGFKGDCAIATTVAHDCHQLIVTGTDEQMMAIAANRLAAVGGGQIVVREGETIGLVELPIGGLMSNQPAASVAAAAEKVLAGFAACGCSLNNPNMQLSLLGLVVIPELRISDLGLVDVTRFEFIPVLQKLRGVQCQI